MLEIKELRRGRHDEMHGSWLHEQSIILGNSLDAPAEPQYQIIKRKNKVPLRSSVSWSDEFRFHVMQNGRKRRNNIREQQQQQQQQHSVAKFSSSIVNLVEEINDELNLSRSAGGESRDNLSTQSDDENEEYHYNHRHRHRRLARMCGRTALTNASMMHIDDNTDQDDDHSGVTRRTSATSTVTSSSGGAATATNLSHRFSNGRSFHRQSSRSLWSSSTSALQQQRYPSSSFLSPSPSLSTSASSSAAVEHSSRPPLLPKQNSFRSSVTWGEDIRKSIMVHGKKTKNKSNLSSSRSAMSIHQDSTSVCSASSAASRSSNVGGQERMMIQHHPQSASSAATPYEANSSNHPTIASTRTKARTSTATTTMSRCRSSNTVSRLASSSSSSNSRRRSATGGGGGGANLEERFRLHRHNSTSTLFSKNYTKPKALYERLQKEWQQLQKQQQAVVQAQTVTRTQAKIKMSLKKQLIEEYTKTKAEVEQLKARKQALLKEKERLEELQQQGRQEHTQEERQEQEGQQQEQDNCAQSIENHHVSSEEEEGESHVHHHAEDGDDNGEDQSVVLKQLESVRASLERNRKRFRLVQQDSIRCRDRQAKWDERMKFIDLTLCKMETKQRILKLEKELIRCRRHKRPSLPESNSAQRRVSVATVSTVTTHSSM